MALMSEPKRSYNRHRKRLASCRVKQFYWERFVSEIAAIRSFEDAVELAVEGEHLGWREAGSTGHRHLLNVGHLTIEMEAHSSPLQLAQIPRIEPDTPYGGSKNDVGDLPGDPSQRPLFVPIQEFASRAIF